MRACRLHLQRPTFWYQRELQYVHIFQMELGVVSAEIKITNIPFPFAGTRVKDFFSSWELEKV